MVRVRIGIRVMVRVMVRVRVWVRVRVIVPRCWTPFFGSEILK